MGRTVHEINAALVSVRAAITAAEQAQEYSSTLGNKNVNADLVVLYAREERLLQERANIMTGGRSAGLIRNTGVVRR